MSPKKSGLTERELKRRAGLIERNKKMWNDPSYREKQSRSHTGKRKPLGHGIKISKAQATYWREHPEQRAVRAQMSLDGRLQERNQVAFLNNSGEFEFVELANKVCDAIAVKDDTILLLEFKFGSKHPYQARLRQAQERARLSIPANYRVYRTFGSSIYE